MSLLKPKHRHGDRIQLGPAPLRLVVNPRAKRIVLRFDARTREATVTAPSERRLADGVTFARQRQDWILKRLALVEARPTVEPLSIPEKRAAIRRARVLFDERVAAHCEALGAPRPTLRLTDTRSRWGSCTQAHHGKPASVRLSWRLILAPFEVADYVVAHECAHILEANHGPRFWAHVRRLVGDPRPHRAWLREHGSGLLER